MQFEPKKCGLFCLILKNSVVFWDLELTLFDISKDVVISEILVFSNIFGFTAVNWVSKWTETVNFGYLPFKLKFKIQNTVTGLEPRTP